MQSPRTILTPERQALGRFVFTLRPWRNLLQARRVIYNLTQRRLQERFRGSMLGAVWVFLLPLLMLSVYSFAFVGMLGIGGNTRAEKIAATFSLFCGLIVYSMFNETIARSAVCIVSQPQFVKKIVFPLDALPVVAFGESLVLASASVTVLLLGVAVMLQRVHPTWILLPLPLLLLATVAIGLGWLLAAIGVFVRDLGQVLTVVMQMLFFLTPICYPIEVIPPWARTWMMLNPLVPIIEAMRAVVLRGELPSFAQLGVVGMVGLCCMHVGHAAFLVMRRRFADVL